MMQTFQPWIDQFEKWIPLIARILVAVVFLYAGYQKIANFGQFIINLSQITFLPVTAAAVLVIIFEISGGLALLLGFKTKIASLVLLLFMIASGVILTIGFKLATEVFWNALLLINVGMMAALLLISKHGSDYLSFDKKMSQNTSPTVNI